MEKLAMVLKKNFLRYYHFFSMISFLYRGKKIKSYNKVLKDMNVLMA